jgi:hypothetical protein
MTRQISEFGPSAGVSIITSPVHGFDHKVRLRALHGLRASTRSAREPADAARAQDATAGARHARALRVARIVDGFGELRTSCRVLARVRIQRPARHATASTGCNHSDSKYDHHQQPPSH